MELKVEGHTILLGPKLEYRDKTHKCINFRFHLNCMKLKKDILQQKISFLMKKIYP